MPEVALGVAFAMLYPKLSLRATFFELAKDEPVVTATLPAGLIVDTLHGGSDNLEVLIRLKNIVHFSALPHTREKRVDDAIEGRGGLELNVAVPVPNGESKLARGPDHKFGCRDIGPCSTFVRGGESDDTMLPHKDLFRGSEMAGSFMIVIVARAYIQSIWSDWQICTILSRGFDMGSGMGWSCAGVVAARPLHKLLSSCRDGLVWGRGSLEKRVVGVVFMVATVAPLRPEVGGVGRCPTASCAGMGGTVRCLSPAGSARSSERCGELVECGTELPQAGLEGTGGSRPLECRSRRRGS